MENEAIEMQQAVQDSTIKSAVLKKLNHSPNTACAACTNAVWMQTRSGKIQIFCRLMHVLVDQEIGICDGQMMIRE